MILISSKLRSLRIEKNLKQAQVAEKVGVNKSAISAYENDLRQPSYHRRGGVCAFYAVIS